MDKQQAAKLLGVSASATVSDVEAAFQAKSLQTQAKIDSAPTDALKDKLQTMQAALKQAQQVLATASKPDKSSSASKKSPLTESKLFDIPGMAPEDVEQIELQPGSVLAGRYTIEKQIGAGGMGAVYSAIDANTNEAVAIKLMLPSLVDNSRAQQRFMDEARISQKLSHPNIVNVFDVQQQEGLYFLTMELLEGQDLRSYLENLKLLKQSAPQDEVIRITQSICDALSYAHETTVHRDIKPENIWLTDDGKVKVMDFGLARLQSASQRSSSGAVLGTAYYMAPEQIQGRSDVDGKADQYAIGVLLYEMLSGQIPAGKIESLHTVNKDVPKKLSLTVDRLLATNPEGRFASVGELKAALDNTGGFVMPGLPAKGLGIAATVIVAVLLLGGLAGSGGLDNVWEALKPIDKEQLARDKAEVAKLQGEIKNYQRRLENGRRQLDSDLRDAARNNDKSEKYLAHWQTVTDNYLFEGDQITELEGELSMGESLLRENSIEQAKTTLTQVRDGYKGLWEQFSVAEDLKASEDEALEGKAKWTRLKNNYAVTNGLIESLAIKAEERAVTKQQEGAFAQAVEHWAEAAVFWSDLTVSVAEKVASIDVERKRVARVKKTESEKRALQAELESNKDKVKLILNEINQMINYQRKQDDSTPGIITKYTIYNQSFYVDFKKKIISISSRHKVVSGVRNMDLTSNDLDCKLDWSFDSYTSWGTGDFYRIINFHNSGRSKYDSDGFILGNYMGLEYKDGRVVCRSLNGGRNYNQLMMPVSFEWAERLLEKWRLFSKLLYSIKKNEAALLKYK